jgi:hypothetical protein
MYLAAAREILDRALVQGNRPPVIRWHFVPIVGPGDQRRVRLDEIVSVARPIDRRRVRLDEKNPFAVINGGNNKQEGAWVVVHHEYWDKHLDAHRFQVPVEGTYAIRIHAAGRVPARDEVVASAEKFLRQRRDQEEKDPRMKPHAQRRYEFDLAHFKSDWMYNYGPPRLKLIQQLGPLPRVIAEFDVDAIPSAPKTYTVLARFTAEMARIQLEYAYDIGRNTSNSWMQLNESFRRPELMIDWFEVEGPLYDAWPPSSHTMVLFPPPRHSTEQAYAQGVLERFMRRAYRRPVSSAEVASKLTLFTAARKGAPFIEAIKVPLMAVLTSPHSLFLAEPGSDGQADRPRPLTDHEMAARLSYFLWSSMPDERLFQLADRGELKTAEVLEAEVDRMLADKKSDAFVRDFAGQWLGLREVGANPPVPALYPHYDRHLEISIVRESEAYFREFLANDLDVRQMIRSDFVVINERLARFYGIPGVRGDDFRRVDVPKGVHRGGIVTQASILSTTSNGTRTSPVKRGTWILRTLMGVDPGLPVANVGEIAPKVPGIDKATVRQRLEIHRTLPQCARCHNKIDPLGFALENYNAAGEWRLQEGFGYLGRIEPNDPRIDASSVMPDGTRIDGVDGLQRAILKNEDMFLSCLASKLMTYAYGRELGLADQPVVKRVVARTKNDHYTLRSLVKAVVASDGFGTK